MLAEHAPRFPNPDLAPRLVLYPITGGGAALEWRLDQAVVEQAFSAFAPHQAVAKLYLRRVDADGAQLAEAMITDLSSNRRGRAHFHEPLFGVLQAELGLEDQRDGGWLLLARSNQLQAVPKSTGLKTLAPTGLETLAPRPASEPGPEPGVSAGPESALEPKSTLKPGAEPRAEAALLVREFEGAPAAPEPLERATDGPRFPRLAQSTPDRRVSLVPLLWARSPSPSPGPKLGPAPAAGTGAGVQLRTRFPDPSLVALVDRPELHGAPFPLIATTDARRLGSEGAASVGISSAAVLARFADQPSGGLSTESPAAAIPRVQAFAGADSETASEPIVGSSHEQVLLDQQPPNRQDVAPSERLASGHGARGSGPMTPYPTEEGAVVQGELHVFGRAAPGSLLDLGGHPFRVGPGGRFSFHVALDDPDLLTALLERLPRLPVVERDS